MEIVYKLMPLTRQLYAETSKIAWILLFLFFLLSLVFVYVRTPQGSSDFLDVLKRLVIAMLLLTSFPQITHWIQAISSGMTETISQVSTYGAFFELLKERLNAIIERGWTGSIFLTDDLLLSILSFLSYLVVYISRYLMLAIYQFYWALLIVLAPILISFYMFRTTARVTGNLYRSLIEISLWPFVWEIMGVMLSSLWAGEKMSVEGNYLTVILLNLVIALAMILTPYVVHSLMGQGLSATAGTLGGIATATIITAPTKIRTITQAARAITNSPVVGATKTLIDNWHQKQFMNRAVRKVIRPPDPPSEGKKD